MKFIGNFKNWIDPEVINFILKNDGTKRPGGGRNPDSEEFKIAASSGYDLSETWWYIYEPDTLPFDIIPPIEKDKKIIWWFIKLLPGGKMPMHRDPHTYDSEISNVVRYWMPLQDYEPGHIFIYDKTFMHSYKAGDLYMYTDSDEIHGCCNIGYSTRLTFQFSTYEIIK